MALPDIIFLNGTSSSGKTTLAKTLQGKLEAAYLHVALDAFAGMFPECKLGDQELCASAAPRLFKGFYHSVAALVSCGNKVIVDTVDREHGAEWFETLFQPFSVLYVAVNCPLEEVEKRELARGDRTLGLARAQFAEVHQLLRYDLEVDTQVQNAEECAAFISQAVERLTQRP